MRFFSYFSSDEYLPNCSEDEINECFSCRLFDNVLNLIMVLDSLRDYLHYPIEIKSTYRSVEHNRRVHGAVLSQHLQGAAIDFTCNKIPFVTLTYLIKDFFQKSALADFIGEVKFFHKQQIIHFGLRTRNQPKLIYYHYEQGNN